MLLSSSWEDSRPPLSALIFCTDENQHNLVLWASYTRLPENSQLNSTYPKTALKKKKKGKTKEQSFAYRKSREASIPKRKSNSEILKFMLCDTRIEKEEERVRDRQTKANKLNKFIM